MCAVHVRIRNPLTIGKVIIVLDQVTAGTNVTSEEGDTYYQMVLSMYAEIQR